MFFTKEQYEILKAMTFHKGYKGFRPDVYEAPNRDGKLDIGKLYSHISSAYTHPCDATNEYLLEACRRVEKLARSVAAALGVPEEFWPCAERSAIRVLWYPENTPGHVHTDVDLFTLSLYRDPVDAFHSESNSFFQVGEMGTLLGLGPATKHYVDATPGPQRSIVYAANSRDNAVLPNGQTAGEWLRENIKPQRIRADTVTAP